MDKFILVSLKRYAQIQSSSAEEQFDLRHYRRGRDLHNKSCAMCGHTPIWVGGSAKLGQALCFTCITGEVDASQDYDLLPE